MKNLICLAFALINVLFAAAQDRTIVINQSTRGNKSGYDLLKNSINQYGSGRLTIIIEDGVYTLDQVLVIDKNNVNLDLKGKATIRFSSNSGGIVIRGNNCSIKNGTFIGNGISAKTISTGFGIFLAGVKNATIAGNTFMNTSGVPIFLGRSSNGSGCQYASIQGNKISKVALRLRDDGDEAGILIGYSGDNYFHLNNSITNNVIEGNNVLNVGIGLIGHGKDNLISGNTVRNCRAYGIIAYESDYTEKSLYRTTIRNNDIENIGRTDGKSTKKGMGIYLMKSQNSIIENNTVINTLLGNDRSETLGSGAITLNGALNSKVVGNTIERSQMYGITNAFSFNTDISNNIINGIQKSAVYFINVSDVRVNNNKIKSVNEIVFKGFFENTSLNYIRKTWKFAKYQNINTGNNISIIGNIIDDSNRLIDFVSNKKSNNYKGQVYKGNILNNNVFKNNTINSPSLKLEAKKSSDMGFTVVN